MAKTITSVNSVYMLTVATLFTTPVALQGYAADDMFSTDPRTMAETLLGLDGKLSGGYVHSVVKQKIHLQADSDSIAVFDQWVQASDTAADVFYAQATISLPGLGKTYTCKNGILKMAKVIPDVKKILAVHEYEIDWESVTVNQG